MIFFLHFTLSITKLTYLPNWWSSLCHSPLHWKAALGYIYIYIYCVIDLRLKLSHPNNIFFVQLLANALILQCFKFCDACAY